jgi:aminopeptidase C
MVFGDRDCQQLAFTSALQRMNHAQSQDIVNVVADVGIKNQRNSGRPWLVGANRERKTEYS